MMSPNTSNGFNLPKGVTDLTPDIYDLHVLVFWICVVIAVVVFGAMIYSLLKLRRSQEAGADTSMVNSTSVEMIWTIIPLVILVSMAVPAAETVLEMQDTRNTGPSTRVSGDQWRYQYQYMGDADGIDYFSTLAEDSNFARRLHSGIDPKSVPNFLLSVDKSLVVPRGTQARLLLSSQDAIYAWWVPDFGVKRDAIPGFGNELWFPVTPGQEGIYRGQCAALCGRDHGFVPIVVEVRAPDSFKKGADSQTAELRQVGDNAPATDARAPVESVKTAQVVH